MLILILILLIGLILSTIGLIRYTTIKNTMDTETEFTKLSDDARLHFSKELLNFIDELIEVEINNKLKAELIMGKEVDIRLADDAVRDIAKTVYEAIDSEIYSSTKGSIINPKYVMTYITRRSLLMYVTYVREHNKSILA